MKVAELREMSAEDLRRKVDELQEERFNLRFQKTLGQLTSPIRLRQLRRDIARVHTVLRERGTGSASTPKTEGDKV
ncbi:MAG: 50S ribosomal protein L29 [Candidatus Latescibacteria bacterium]|nr:50S ribosomal protein L29 [Candidatus Latescibacterota bacterium]